MDLLAKGIVLRRGRHDGARPTAAASVWRTRIGLAPMILLAALAVFTNARAIDFEVKREWQDQYRELRMQAARLELTAELATKEYADANRRNYRRSGVRHFHRANAIEARTELARVHKEMRALRDTARSAGVPTVWFDEVDEEPIDMSRVQALGDYADGGRFGGRGAYGPGAGEAGDPIRSPVVEDGRNPLYKEQQGPPAGIDPLDETPYDYEEWLNERQGEEDEPER